mmetsp:Transcript_59589/g.53666  ORF Transcript_59589/g.53666 Transcript_59589/m.53666 type:complete len:271 (-) Transcript_59589:42-854(-)
MGALWSHTTNNIFDYGKSQNENGGYKPSQELKPNDIPGILQSISVFSHLTDEESQELVRTMRYRKYKYNETIIQQGDDGSEFYLICRGLVKVLIADIHNNGKSKQVATLKTGDTFGETSLICDKPRNATIKCVQDTKVVYCDKYTFLAVTNKHKQNKIDPQQNISDNVLINNDNEGKDEEKGGNIAADPELAQRLNEYGLSRWIPPLINKLGVECLNDLKYCSTQDFQSIGCKIVQIKKLQEIISKYVNNQNNAMNAENNGHQRRHTSFY